MKTTPHKIFDQLFLGGYSIAEFRRALSSMTIDGVTPTTLDQEIELHDGSIFRFGKKNVYQYDAGHGRWFALARLRHYTEYGLTLRDSSDGPEQPTMELKIRANERFLQIGAEEFGEFAAEDGSGFPIVIEYWEGEFRILAFANINDEEPTHVISLDGAREDLRKAGDATL